MCPVYPWVSDEPPYAYHGAPDDAVEQAGTPWGNAQQVEDAGERAEGDDGSDSDSDSVSSTSSNSTTTTSKAGSALQASGGRRRRLWYQVLRDDRDHSQPRHQYTGPPPQDPEGEGEGEGEGDGSSADEGDGDGDGDSADDSLMRAVYNFEYVAHSDLLPYIPHNSRRSIDPHATAFRNSEFGGLFHTVSLSNDNTADRGDLAIAKEGLSEWFNLMTTVLRDASISTTTTIEKNATVRVSVLTVFKDVSEGLDGEKRWTWFNRVTLHNVGSRAIQVYGRHLEETELDGDDVASTRYSSGKGVVGMMPIVAGKTSFWFLSNVQLGRASGTAGGHYHALVMQESENSPKATREHFDLHIPEVMLLEPMADGADDADADAHQNPAKPE